jgi:hypothetical protein
MLSVPRAIFPVYWTLMACQSLSPSSAVERPQLRLVWLTVFVLSLEPYQGVATPPVEPIVSPGEPSPGDCSTSRLGGWTYRPLAGGRCFPTVHSTRLVAHQVIRKADDRHRPLGGSLAPGFHP